jgi:hypothetical protein
MFGKHGLFDEQAETGADFEWTGWVTRNGGTLSCEPEATVSHPAEKTGPSSSRNPARQLNPWAKTSGPATTSDSQKIDSNTRTRRIPLRQSKDSLIPPAYLLTVITSFAVLTVKVALVLSVMRNKLETQANSIEEVPGLFNHVNARPVRSWPV